MRMFHAINRFALSRKVRLIGLEPTRREAPDPKSGVSTNFTTGACLFGEAN